MEKMIRGGANHFLSYDEMAEIRNEHSPLTQHLVDDIKQHLLEQIRIETPNTIDYDKVFRIQIRLFDDMNLVGKLEEVPIIDVPLRIPGMDPMGEREMYIDNKPLKFRDRIKILIKGRLD